eukprot:m.68338 g.68338  ORF g.68338 m.68338 type:complete len:304 (-) comp14175_c1_seq3:492-1403(-)
MAGKSSWVIDTHAQAALTLLDRYDSFLLDCDGVLWQGGEVVPGAAEALQLLTSLGKRIVYVTNNSTRSRKEYTSKFAKLHIQPDYRDIYPASYAAALYIAEQGARKAFVIGGEGLQAEIKAFGIDVVPGNSVPALTSEDDFCKLTVDPAIDAVVCAFDFGLSYTKIAFASLVLEKNPTSVFVGTSRDQYDQLLDRRIPGMTAGVAGIEATSGRAATIVGKPSTWLAATIMRDKGLDPRRTCMVGDRLDSDILFGNRSGIDTIAVLTGCTSLEQLLALKPDSEDRPTHVLTSFGLLAPPATSSL